MKIAIGCDHGGLHLKQEIKELLSTLGHEVEDFGTHSTESCDYPDIDICFKEDSHEFLSKTRP